MTMGVGGRVAGAARIGRVRAARCGLVVAILLVPGATAARAQAIPELRVGETITGTLTQADPSMSGNGPFKVYRLEAQEGQRLIATLRSGAFDALLTLMRPVGGVSETLGSDDDSGGGSDARLRFVVPVSGTYHIIAQSYAADERGGFTLMLEQAPPERPAPPQPIRVGETKHGRLDESSPLLYDENADAFYHLYTFGARAGQQLVISMESSDFDTYVAFGTMRGDIVEVSATDDDGGSETNSRLRVSIEEDGRYGFHARTLDSGATGSYTITLREARLPEPRVLAAGRDIAATLGDADADADNRYYHFWTYQGVAGEALRLGMKSDDFDTLLSIGRMVNGRFEELEQNDDATDQTTDSLLEFTLPAAGEYVIRAACYQAGEAGRYTLRLDSARR